MSFTAGENVGSYRIIEKLGQGGMATVFKAYHPSLDRFVAIKVLHPAFKEDPQFLERFQREARVVARLEHPNIVPVYDFAEQEGQPYLVMKFIEGETLKARLIRSPLLKKEAYKTIKAVGNALTYAHNQGVLHRDIKPSNILIAEDGQVYLTDFGLARMAEAGASTLTGDQLMGTPHYISPEQARGEKKLNACTDIYSFGIVLYEIVVGRVPFSADTPFSIIHDHIYTPLPLPSEVNPKVPLGIQQVLLKALAKDPEDRYASGNELVDAFFAALSRKNEKVIVPVEMTDTRSLADEVEIAAPLSESVLEGKSEADVMATVTGQVKPITPTSRPSKRWVWIAAGIVMTCLTLFAFLAIANRPGIRTLFDKENTVAAENKNPEGIISSIENDALTAVEKRPDDPGAHLQLADVLQREGKNQDAAQEYLEAGLLFIDENRFDEGIKALIEAINLQGGLKDADPEIVEMVVEILFMSAKDQNLASMYDQIAGRFPNWEVLKICEARSYLYREQMERTQMLLDEALGQNPNSHLGKAVMAELTFMRGMNDEALIQVEELLRYTGLPVWLNEHLQQLERDIREKM